MDREGFHSISAISAETISSFINWQKIICNYSESSSHWNHLFKQKCPQCWFLTSEYLLIFSVSYNYRANPSKHLIVDSGMNSFHYFLTFFGQKDEGKDSPIVSCSLVCCVVILWVSATGSGQKAGNTWQQEHEHQDFAVSVMSVLTSLISGSSFRRTERPPVSWQLALCASMHLSFLY